jgi:hypothetical protein
MVIQNKQIQPWHFSGIDHLSDDRSINPATVKARIVTAIIVMSKARGVWFDFTFNYYKEFCGPKMDMTLDEAALDVLVSEDKMLDKTGSAYSVNDRFFVALARHIIVPVAVPAK